MSTRVPGSIEMMFFSVGDWSGLGLSFGDLLMGIGLVNLRSIAEVSQQQKPWTIAVLGWVKYKVSLWTRGLSPLPVTHPSEPRYIVMPRIKGLHNYEIFQVFKVIDRVIQKIAGLHFIWVWLGLILGLVTLTSYSKNRLCQTKVSRVHQVNLAFEILSEPLQPITQYQTLNGFNRKLGRFPGYWTAS